MYTTKNYSHLLGLKGFSNQALETHFKLYSSYVDNTNKLLEKLKSAEEGSPESAELRRRLGWEFNGMRLHEIYFSSLAKEPSALEQNSKLSAQITKDFGSAENWKKEFNALALSRGIGWTILYWDPQEKKLINFWIEQHHNGHPAGLVPILPLDMFEHAFFIDWRTDKSSYIETFLASLDWKTIEKRLN